MTATDTLAGGIPLGWAWGILDEDTATPVYYAYAEHRDGPAACLHFESTSAIDLVDQVHEALDAWQTDLEMRLALNRRPA